MQQIMTEAAQIILKQKPISASKTVQSANLGLLISAFLTIVPVVSGTAAQLFPDNAKDIAMGAGLITTVAGLFGYKASNDAKSNRIAVGDLYNGSPTVLAPPPQPAVVPQPPAYRPDSVAFSSGLTKQPAPPIIISEAEPPIIDEPTESIPPAKQLTTTELLAELGMRMGSPR